MSSDKSTEQINLEALLSQKNGGYYELWRDMTDVGTIIDGYETVATIEDDEGRWTRHMRTIIKSPLGNHFMFQWNRGLTENQEDIRYDEQTYPVDCTVRTIEVVEWHRKS